MQFKFTLPSNFFESVQMHPLSHRGGKYNVETTDLQIISYEFEYRGSKAAFGPSLPPFWLRHEQAFEGACQIFEQLFQHKPDLFAWFHDDHKTWNAFLVTSRRFHPYEEATTSNMIDEPLYDLLVERYGFRRHFEHFPVIGSLNSYAVTENPGFYYLVATPFGSGSGSFLTLDNFRFRRDEDKALFIQQPLKAIQSTVNTVSKAFQKAEIEFNSLLNSMAGESIAREAFGPVILDLYDINRNQESVANDERLRYRIRKKMNDVASFLPLHHTTIPWTDFIQFIIRNNEVNLNAGLRQDQVEELFSRKQAYGKFENLFTKFLKDPARYQRYVLDQEDDWQAVANLI